MGRKIGITLIVTGLALILFAIALLLYNDYENNRAEQQSEKIVNSMIDMIGEEGKTSGTDPFDTEMKVVELNGHGYIGYVSVPEIGINLPVMSEWDYSKLKIAPCRYFGSTKTDNLVICAHNFRSHFGNIRKLNPGAAVMFTDMEGITSNYTVTAIEVLFPTDTDKVKDTGDDLILYTCTYGGRTRVVVRCERV